MDHKVSFLLKFLLYEDEDGVIWLLDKGTDFCKCCKPNLQKEEISSSKQNSTGNNQNPRKTRPFDVVIYRPQIQTSANTNKISPTELSASKLSSDITTTSRFPLETQNNPKKYVKKPANVITQQPLPSKQKMPNPKPAQKETEKEEKPNCCKLCCIECGTCCVNLLNSA
uniref:Uncharacterized protein n=1 Tax=Panagrolaimus sp. JU765 TaxID=591449 RepID=A0AC34R2L8_9BILA